MGFHLHFNVLIAAQLDGWFFKWLNIHAQIRKCHFNSVSCIWMHPTTEPKFLKEAQPRVQLPEFSARPRFNRKRYMHKWVLHDLFPGWESRTWKLRLQILNANQVARVFNHHHNSPLITLWTPPFPQQEHLRTSVTLQFELAVTFKYMHCFQVLLCPNIMPTF